MLSIVSIIIVIAIVLLFLWSRGKINELHEKIAILRDEIENLKKKRDEQKQDIDNKIEKSKEEQQPQKGTEISEPEPKLPDPQKKDAFYLGMPNAKGFLKEESQRAGYFIAQESGQSKAFFVFVNDQAKLNVIFKNDMEGKFYKVEKGIALPGKVLLNQTKGIIGRKGDFWAVQKPITIELGN